MRHPSARLQQPKQPAIANQRLCKHVPTAKCVAMEKMLENRHTIVQKTYAVLYTQLVPKSHKEAYWTSHSSRARTKGFNWHQALGTKRNCAGEGQQLFISQSEQSAGSFQLVVRETSSVSE
jgi:hypothetical protein